MDIQEVLRQLADLQKNFNDLKAEFYRNNFTAHQDFNKSVNFSAGLKFPHFANLPTVAEQGQVCEVGGKFYGAKATNTWELIGTQT